jgi:ferredoxin-NADP reductase
MLPSRAVDIGLQNPSRESPNLLQLKVVRIEALTPRISRFALISAGGDILPIFTAGSHIDIGLPNEETRSYSLLNDSGETHRYVLGVLRERKVSAVRFIFTIGSRSGMS